ncbi:DUF2079 domain-containing protein [Aerosakkonema funiforme]|uniref:DUF2079 domain-containing protein n=2 Tax=Oscillatoriophycideae TaxID=1301283 RepID=A0A926VCC4_9CYAN|nr:DUF2079 domain-containing protein [Aerosakkonema funiforme]MBD2181090.1 DUF2079 domain-containing protein [Aerosakkonema funiforme FACHB-1375]
MLLNWRKYPWLLVALGSAIAFFVLALTLTLHRHYTFYSSYDQGIFNQVFWNGIHGRFFQSSLSSQLSTNVVHSNDVPNVYYHRLGQHFTPALLLWIPLYALFPSPATLTVLLVTLVTAAGLVLYVLARQYVQGPIAAAIAGSFYTANAVVGPTLCNFHDICQIPLFVFGLLLAMEKRWWWLFAVLAVLILAVREDSGIGLFGVGVYMILSKRYPRIGLAVCAVSFGYTILLTNLIMPLFSADISERFMMERFGQYADGDSASTLEIIWGMVKNPWRLLVELFSPFPETMKYLLAQWLPLAFVPAVSPAAWAIAGFPLLKLFLGQGESVLAINIRYAMTVVPGLFYGAILWWSRHPEKFKKLSFRRFWVICICISLFFTITSNPNRTISFLVPDSFKPWVYVSLPRQWQHAGEIYSLLAKIPPNASVAATTYIVPHLSGRREIIRFPGLQLRNDKREVVNVEYAIADLWQLREYQVAFKTDRQILKDSIVAIDGVSGNHLYGITDFKDGVILLHRGVADNPDAVAAWLTFRRGIEAILK